MNHSFQDKESCTDDTSEDRSGLWRASLVSLQPRYLSYTAAVSWTQQDGGAVYPAR